MDLNEQGEGNDSISESARQSYAHASDAARQVGEKVAEGAKCATESARQSYAHARDAARQVADQVKDSMGDCCQKTRDRAVDLGKQAEEIVSEHPMTSLLIGTAAGILVGAVLGMILRRR